jgi:4-diphosphocytidyl-2-C-methyl-D-erythritol kinase
MGIIRGNKIRTFGKERGMSRNQTTTFAYAKINLALAITGRRPDGYHELQSVMQSLELHDRVTVTETESGIECFCGELSGPDNLAYRAAKLFLDRVNSGKGVQIEIEKQIPVQAGLAGGSSDAAAALRALNLLFGEPCSMAELRQIAARIGADVAFCLEGGTQWAAGVGEHLERLPACPRMNVILIKPQAGIDTGTAYRVFDEVGEFTRLDDQVWKEALQAGNIQEIAMLLSNDLEQASMKILTEIALVKEAIAGEKGCLGALMSGSGSAVFGIMETREHAEKIAIQFREKGYDVWVTTTIEGGACSWKEN